MCYLDDVIKELASYIFWQIINLSITKEIDSHLNYNGVYLPLRLIKQKILIR